MGMMDKEMTRSLCDGERRRRVELAAESECSAGKCSACWWMRAHGGTWPTVAQNLRSFMHFPANTASAVLPDGERARFRA